MPGGSKKIKEGRNRDRKCVYINMGMGTRGENQPYCIIGLELAIRTFNTTDVIMYMKPDYVKLVKETFLMYRNNIEEAILAHADVEVEALAYL